MTPCVLSIVSTGSCGAGEPVWSFHRSVNRAVPPGGGVAWKSSRIQRTLPSFHRAKTVVWHGTGSPRSLVRTKHDPFGAMPTASGTPPVTGRKPSSPVTSRTVRASSRDGIFGAAVDACRNAADRKTAASGPANNRDGFMLHKLRLVRFLGQRPVIHTAGGDPGPRPRILVAVVPPDLMTQRILLVQHVVV